MRPPFKLLSDGWTVFPHSWAASAALCMLKSVLHLPAGILRLYDYPPSTQTWTATKMETV